MESKLLSFYRSADIDAREAEHLMVLRESCATLEERVRLIAEQISDSDRQILLAYIDARDELEFEMVKEALCRGSENRTKDHAAKR